MFDVNYAREGSRMKVTVRSTEGETDMRTFYVALPAVEIEIPTDLPPPGAITAQLKVLDQEYVSNRAIFTLAAAAGSEYDITVRANVPNVACDQGPIRAGRAHVRFPDGTGYQTKTLTCQWTGAAK
jgi:hypothetical protein